MVNAYTESYAEAAMSRDLVLHSDMRLVMFLAGALPVWSIE